MDANKKRYISVSLNSMSVITCRNTIKPLLGHKRETKSTRPAASSTHLSASDVCPNISLNIRRVEHLGLSTHGKSIERIKDMFQKVELSVSPYDTAWVAMVPVASGNHHHHHQPFFPECLNWIMENQHPDGSWTSLPSGPLLVKDSLSSTLACILALQKWNLGQQLVNKGLDFIGSNAWAISDKDQHSPIGFDIIFPRMMAYAQDMGLNLPINSSLVGGMLDNRDVLVQRALKSELEGEKAFLAYVAEGLSSLDEWNDVIKKHQRRNGSVFNSPSTTAAALLHFNDDKCFMYLSSLLKRYQNAVPTVYPFDVYTRLSMVDNLMRLGIDQYFSTEIEATLDHVYRCWQRGDDQIFLDISCLAMAFRLLRMNGYEVSSDVFAGLGDQEHFFNSASPQYKNIETILELYRASQITLLPSEQILDKIHAWTGSFLKQASVEGAFCDKNLQKEVEYALKYTHASLERLENRKSIELYKEDNVRLLKTSYRCFSNNNRDLLGFALQDFNRCQYIQQKELETVERWVKDYRIDQLKFARQKATYGYFAAASILYSPELSDARISWAKNTVLVTLIDDLFDFGGSTEELLNMMELVKMWDQHSAVGYCSEQVEIIFSAIFDTTNDYAAKASIEQGRNVKNHLIQIWVTLLDSMWREVEWARDKSIPSIDDYISSAYVSVALGPVVLVPLYFLGCKLSEEAVASEEYESLFEHMSTIARLLNDLTTNKREREQGKMNSLSLRVIHGKGRVSEEEAARETRRVIEKERRELLRMVVESKGSVIPKACKQVFWRTSKILHLFYMSNDGYSSPHEMISAINSVIHEPILLPNYY